LPAGLNPGIFTLLESALYSFIDVVFNFSGGGRSLHQRQGGVAKIRRILPVKGLRSGTAIGLNWKLLRLIFSAFGRGERCSAPLCG